MATTTGGSTRTAWAAGGMLFTAALLVVVGAFQIIMGIAAIIKDQFFVVTANYVYEFNTTAWGWIHLGIGVLALVAGVALFGGATWARITAITVLTLSAIANFFWLPYYPIWAILIIAIDVFAIWAVANAPRGEAGAGMAGSAGYESRQFETSGARTGVSDGQRTTPTGGYTSQGPRTSPG